jgi:hypothetical protein
MRVVELCLNVAVPGIAKLASEVTEKHLGVWPGWPAAAGGSARAVAQARVADLLHRGLSGAKFLAHLWRDTGRFQSCFGNLVATSTGSLPTMI